MNHMHLPASTRALRAVLLASIGLAACAREAETPAPAPDPSLTPAAFPAASAAMEPRSLTLGAQLSGDREVPPVRTPARGVLEATLVPGTRVLSWTVEYAGLSSPLTGAHFHGPAQPDQISAIAVPIPKPLNGSPLRGSATLSDAQMAELRAGSWYVNLHTATHPGGEIRGQVQIRP